MNTSNQTDAISKAVYVEDGKVLPENEGKIVIVPGKAEAIEPFVDTLTGVEIPHIKATRSVEVYDEATETDEDFESLNWSLASSSLVQSLPLRGGAQCAHWAEGCKTPLSHAVRVTAPLKGSLYNCSIN